MKLKHTIKTEDERKDKKQDFRRGEFVRTSNLRKTFHKEDTTSWRYGLYTITETKDDTIPIYYLDSFPEKPNEASLKKTSSTKTQNDNVYKKLSSK